MPGLGFIHPYLLAGILAGALPILIHMLYRRRARIIRFSAMRFVILSYKKVARRLLLREYLLLLVRCLLVAAIAIAMARPIFSRVIQGMNSEQGPTATAIILDNSYSMMSRVKSGSLFDEAKELAIQLINSMSDVDEAAVLFTAPGTGAGSLELGLTRDRKRLVHAVEKVEISYGPSRPLEALHRASPILESASQAFRQIAFITDLQRYGFSQAATVFSGHMPTIYFFDLTRGKEMRNLALGGLSMESVPIQREAKLKIQAMVHNYGRDDSPSHLIQVLLGDKVAARGFISVPGRGAETKQFFLSEPEQGVQEGVVQIMSSDPLAVDDKAYFHLTGGGKVRALVVDGDPKVRLQKSETYFLDKALHPRLYSRSRIDPTTIVTEELENYPLRDFQVLILCNVGKVSRKTAGRIHQFVKDGGGLLFSLGDQVDAEFYNSLWQDLLPRELRGVKSPYAGAEGVSEIRVMHIDRHFGRGQHGEAVHPILSVFRDPGQGDLGLASFFSYFLLQPEVGPATRVILRLTNGTPLMVEKPLGKGIVILYATSLDQAWNDLCLHPTFLPLLQQTVQYLARALRQGDTGELTAGSIVIMPCPQGKAGAVVMDPKRRVFPVRAMDERNQRVIQVHTNQPGIYYLQFLDRMSSARPSSFPPEAADRVLVVNLDLRESDMTKISEKELRKILPAESLAVLGSGETTGQAVAGKRLETPLDRSMLLLVLILLAAELLLVRKG